ncbi:MAG: tetratricopeptide repeat protein [Candidatus Protistobacter heckmanni]|nr:tetratricopeptide repeat protein [Candidatus Protistobacter heckmanni]
MAACKNEFPEALAGLGAMGYREAALQCYDKALALRPAYFEALSNRGNLLHDLHRAEDALASFRLADTLRPGNAALLNNMGMTLHDLYRDDEALQVFNRSLEARPDYAEALNNRGNLLRDRRRHDEAIADYRRAMALQPDYPAPLNNIGILYESTRQFWPSAGELCARSGNRHRLRRRALQRKPLPSAHGRLGTRLGTVRVALAQFRARRPPPSGRQALGRQVSRRHPAGLGRARHRRPRLLRPLCDAPRGHGQGVRARSLAAPGRFVRARASSHQDPSHGRTGLCRRP